MVAECDKCKKAFDSHDGGNICAACNKTFCPECEKEGFEGSSAICRECTPLMRPSTCSQHD